VTGEPERRRRSWFRELPVLLVVALVLALLVKTFLVQAFFIPSGSMETTLHGCTGCTGDRVLVTKPPYWFSDPEPGDVVVFRGRTRGSRRSQRTRRPTGSPGRCSRSAARSASRRRRRTTSSSG
jgi:signal peptidase I